ncbi:MAG: tetratricopeptide repeat protein [Bacteroidales bacterium]|nr:tetratricopeptide repeat protein [Bacteroidales bacterium]
MKSILSALIFVLSLYTSLTAQNIPVNQAIDKMLVNGNYEEAINACKLLLVSDSLNPEINFKLGVAYENILEEELALTSFSRAAALDTLNKAYVFMLAKGYYGMEEYQLAEPLLIKICAIDSMNWLYAYYLTSIYIHLNRYDESINIYNRFLRKDSTNYNYLNKLAFAYLKKGDFARAKELYIKSLFLNQKNLLAIKNLAYLYTTEGKPDTSILFLTEGIEIDPDGIDLYSRRAHLYFSIIRGRSDINDKALTDYLKVLSLGDSSAIYLKRAGVCYTSAEKFGDAIKYLLLAYKADTTDYRTCSYLGFCYYNLKDMKNSISWYNKVIEILTPLYAQMGMTHRYIAASQIGSRLYKSAVSSFLKALEITSDPNIYMEIANLYDERLGNSERAIYYYRKFLDNQKKEQPSFPQEYIESIIKRIEYLKNKPVE